MNKILENLCTAAYRNVNEEITRVYIINAIMKIHCALGYVDNPKVEMMLIDYS